MAEQVKGVSSDAPIVTNEKGGMQSKVEYGFHLCDTGAMLALAETLQYGASHYARDNWRKIPAEEHFNHMLIHYYAWLSGDTSDNHLGHMFCRAMMLYATAKAEDAEKAIPAPDKPDRPTQAELEDLFTDPYDSMRSVRGATSVALGEPAKGKYDGLSSVLLVEAICESVENKCKICPISSFALCVSDSRGCNIYAKNHPAEFRKIAIDYLEGLEKQN